MNGRHHDGNLSKNQSELWGVRQEYCLVKLIEQRNWIYNPREKWTRFEKLQFEFEFPQKTGDQLGRSLNWLLKPNRYVNFLSHVNWKVRRWISELFNWSSIRNYYRKTLVIRTIRTTFPVTVTIFEFDSIPWEVRALKPTCSGNGVEFFILSPSPTSHGLIRIRNLHYFYISLCVRLSFWCSAEFSWNFPNLLQIIVLVLRKVCPTNCLPY